jgi:hypothetical protein
MERRHDSIEAAAAERYWSDGVKGDDSMTLWRRAHLDVLLIGTAAVAVCWVVESWIENTRLGHELDKLKSERSLLVAAVRSQREAFRKDSSDKTATETAIAEFDLSSLPPKVKKAVERLEDPRFTVRQLDSDYAALFRKLRLPGNKLAALKELLGERLRVAKEAIQLSMAEDLSLDDMPDEKEILAAGTAEIDSAISQGFGAEVSAVIETYQASMSARKFMIQPFADHLRFGPNSLNDAQLDELAAAAAQVPFGANTIIARPPGPPIPATLDDAAVRVLSPAQQEAYQEYKTVWEAGRQKAMLDLAFFAQRQAVMTHETSR